jgi:hypothetical protein
MASKYDPLRVNVTKLNAGEAYVATYPDDFTCKPESFQNVVHLLAAQKGNGWKATTVCIYPRTVVYAFFKNTDYMKPNLAAHPVVKKLRGER